MLKKLLFFVCSDEVGHMSTTQIISAEHFDFADLMLFSDFAECDEFSILTA